MKKCSCYLLIDRLYDLLLLLYCWLDLKFGENRISLVQIHYILCLSHDIMFLSITLLYSHIFNFFVTKIKTSLKWSRLWLSLRLLKRYFLRDIIKSVSFLTMACIQCRQTKNLHRGELNKIFLFTVYRECRYLCHKQQVYIIGQKYNVII